MKTSVSSSFQSDLKAIFGINIRQKNHYTQCGLNIAIVSGSSIIIYDPKTDQQLQFIQHSSMNISCIVATSDGKRLAVGQSIKGSVISIYELEGKVISKPKYTIKGHKYGVNMMAWSPNTKYLVSVSNEDGGMFVWQQNIRTTQNKMSKKINKLMFTSQGNLITIGKQHFKIWKFNDGNIIKTQINDCYMMDGKTIGMSKMFADKQFIGVAQKNSKFVALTSEGLLCSIVNDTIDKAADIQLLEAGGIDILQKWVICGGENSNITVIDMDTFLPVSAFPKPPSINQQNIAIGQTIQQQSSNYSRCIDIKVFQSYITVLYQNGMIFIWQINDSVIRAIRCFTGHSDEIQCLELLQQVHSQISFFATSSKDKTLRIWHIYDECFDNKQSINLAQAIGVKRNAYCKYLTRIIYTKQTIKHIKSSESLLIATSSNTIYVYSLNSFALLYQLPTDSSIQAVEAKNNRLAIALSDKTIKIMTISQTMLKSIKIIEPKVNVQEIKLINKNMVVISVNSFFVVDLQTDTVFKNEKDISAAAFLDGKQLFYLKGGKIFVYNLLNKRQKEAFSLENQSFNLEGKLRVINNYILLLSQKQNGSSLMRIWSHEGFLIHEKTYTNIIQNLYLCADGHCIIANKNGSIMIQQFSYRQKFTKIQKQFKRWFQQNDLSWTAGSVWISQDLQKRNNYESAQDLLLSITEPPLKAIPDRFLTQSLAMSTHNKDNPNINMNVNIPYKRNDQRVSIFNPSQISDQVNKIISNVNNIQKKFQGNKSPRTNFDKTKTINLNDPFQQIKFQGQSKLVQSYIPDFQPKMNNFLASQNLNDQMLLSANVNQKSITFPNQHIQIKQNQPTLSRCIQKIYDEISNPKTKQLFVSQNKEKLKVLYQVLHEQFGVNTNYQVANAIQNLSQTYVKNLKSLLNQL